MEGAWALLCCAVLSGFEGEVDSKPVKAIPAAPDAGIKFLKSVCFGGDEGEDGGDDTDVLIHLNSILAKLKPNFRCVYSYSSLQPECLFWLGEYVEFWAAIRKITNKASIKQVPVRLEALYGPYSGIGQEFLKEGICLFSFAFQQKKANNETCYFICSNPFCKELD